MVKAINLSGQSVRIHNYPGSDLPFKLFVVTVSGARPTWMKSDRSPNTHNVYNEWKGYVELDNKWIEVRGYALMGNTPPVWEDHFE